MRLRTVLAPISVAAVLAAATAAFIPQPAPAVTPGPACGERLMRNDRGIQIRVLFAKNGAVQRYEVVDGQDNQEETNDFRLQLENAFGAAGVNAPPVHIVSFKAGGEGGMMMPDKAVDSCGRKFSYL